MFLMFSMLSEHDCHHDGLGHQNDPVHHKKVLNQFTTNIIQCKCTDRCFQHGGIHECSESQLFWSKYCIYRYNNGCQVTILGVKIVCYAMNSMHVASQNDYFFGGTQTTDI